ncbi:hypothetical protein EIP91_006016 [Steccherinum ochraceum]|uniref:Uncharacterized protein n=1 Tax=Steccherinum ochraceum TaxID=92696 RepID=A0A4R0RER5_9APHY|nr:hypothetical protein EIP91_006016 [Steccherinum ochraceum]
MVCKSWRARCRFHLLRNVRFTSALNFASFTLYVNSAPGLKTRVHKLRVDPSDDQAWVSKVPISVRSFTNLRKLSLMGIDFTSLHSHTYKHLSHPQLRIIELEVHHPKFTRYAQITRLVSAIQPHTFLLHLFHADSVPLINSGRFFISGTNLTFVHVDLPVDVLWTIGPSWRICGPKLSEVVVSGHRAVTSGRLPGSLLDIFSSTGAVFARKYFNIFLERGPWPQGALAVPPNTLCHSLDVILFPVEPEDFILSFTELSQALKRLAPCTPNFIKIELPHHKDSDIYTSPSVKDFGPVDAVLSHPSFSALQHFDYTDPDHLEFSEDELDMCMVDILRLALPRCVAKGLLNMHCTGAPWCLFDHSHAESDPGDEIMEDASQRSSSIPPASSTKRFDAIPSSRTAMVISSLSNPARVDADDDKNAVYQYLLSEGVRYGGTRNAIAGIEVTRECYCDNQLRHSPTPSSVQTCRNAHPTKSCEEDVLNA